MRVGKHLFSLISTILFMVFKRSKNCNGSILFGRYSRCNIILTLFQLPTHYLQIFEDKNSEFFEYKFTSKMSSKFVPKFYDHPHLYSTTFKYLGFSKFKISSERQIFNIFVPRNFDSFANIFTFTYFAKSEILYRNVCDAPKDISSIFRCIKLIATRIPHEDK